MTDSTTKGKEEVTLKKLSAEISFRGETNCEHCKGDSLGYREGCKRVQRIGECTNKIFSQAINLENKRG